MKKIIYVLVLFSVSLSSAYSQSVTKSENNERKKWFEDARFGMFVHFGPYSVLGNGEWVMNNRSIKTNDYKRLQDFFNPQQFDAKEWVQIAKNAGVKYITFTSRHHDSFSNWATKQSDWNIMNTPYGKDLIKQLADECRKEGIKLVLYYSLLDWMRNDYQYETGRTGKGTGRTEKGDWMDYINFMKTQLTELLTNYGPIAGIWFDGHWDQTEDKNRTDPKTYVNWHYDEIYGLIHRLQPECLVANNHHLPPFQGEDYQIFERDVPGENTAGHSGQEISRQLPLETCQTINGSWGFSITDDKYKPTKELLHLLIRTAGTGANLLLNVGPMPNGKIQPECIERLSLMGEWMRKYGFTVYGTQRGIVLPQSWGAVTTKDKTHYIHILDKNTSSVTLHIPNIKSAKWINVNSELIWKKDKKTGDVTFSVNGDLDDTDSIIEVTVK